MHNTQYTQTQLDENDYIVFKRKVCVILGRNMRRRESNKHLTDLTDI